MAEEQKNILDSAKEMLQGAVGQGGDLMGKAKDFIGDKAADLLENSDELKKKVVETAGRFRVDNLKKMLMNAVAVEENIKGGIMDSRLALEYFLTA